MKLLAVVAALILAPVLAQAQSHVYMMKIVLNGVTYQGEFVWKPNILSHGCVGGPIAGPGDFYGIAISDPPVTLRYVLDNFTAADCLTHQRELWFSINGGGPYADPTIDYQLHVEPTFEDLGEALVPIDWVEVYRSGVMIAECAWYSPCTQATITEVPTSANGTTVPSATSTTQIVDGQHNLWTLVNGKAVLNGSPTPSSAVVMLLYSSGVVYQENFHNKWWKWVNGQWVVDTSLHTGYSCTDPD